MKLLPLLTHLADEDVGVIAQDLFIDMLPAEADEAVLLRNPLQGTFINHELPGYYQAEFDVIVRVPAAKYDAGEAKIEAVVAVLTVANLQLDDMWFNYARPETLPVSYPLSKGNLIEFSVRMACCFVRR